MLKSTDEVAEDIETLYAEYSIKWMTTPDGLCAYFG